MHKRQAAVSIIVVNYDEWELSAACLRSLHELAYPRERFEVIFVDNASKYHPAAGEISPDFGNLRVIRNKTNEGFVRAVNRGIRCARRDAAYIALVNNDSVVDRGWLRALV
ncbi:MAG: glycosyltransferase, partial [Candidatus Omnitrophica bacterium]|nr:glycosyltransferase [Candidatus Omnitrophota bacterium]